MPEYYGNLCQSCKFGYAKYCVHECLECSGSIESLFYILIIAVLNLGSTWRWLRWCCILL